jgi:Ca2+-binding RTX toxin-like protein
MMFGGAVLPPVGQLVNTFVFTEGISGSSGNDVLLGDELTALELVGHELTNPGLITGLSEVLRGANNFAAGNIILGGAGNDTITPRGGDDIIDGDKELKVRISVRSLLNPNQEIASYDSADQVAAQLFNRSVVPAQLVWVREIVNTANIGDVDSLVLRGPRNEYTVTRVANTADTWIVNHTNVASLTFDGTDTISGIERVVFTDQALNLPRPAVVTTATYAPSDVPVVNQAITVSQFVQTVPNTIAVSYTWQFLNLNNNWVNAATGTRTFTPTVNHVSRPLRVIASYTDSFNQVNSFTSVVTQPVQPSPDLPPNQPATGSVSMTDMTPTSTFAVSADTSTMADGNGMGTVNYQWQSRTNVVGSGFTDIAGATAATYTPNAAQAGRILRVVVSFVDLVGYTETMTSAESGVIGNFFAGTNNVDRYTGTAGSDVMNGLAGADVINGGAGDDTINGGAAGDTLTGGIGSDLFVYNAANFGADLISDFDATPAGGQDLIDLTGLGVTAADFNTRVRYVLSGGTVLITVSLNGVSQGTIRLNSITNINLLDVTDFRLA